jgi:glycosyltransferase involved in cell wall biosynthesis
MPCLNESDTLATCIRKAQSAMQEHLIEGEIIVADNGSTDDSAAIACALGARVVHVEEKGYGSALMGSFAAARGKYILMGDADDSYDFREIPRFVAKLREGADVVQGCRLPMGGGKVMRGAMPFSHRWLGNPMLTLLVRRMFKSPGHDVYCGLRGFTRDFYERLDLRCTGMEFATEFASLAILLGYQSVFFSILTKTFAIGEGLLPRDPRVGRFFDIFDLERGLLSGSAMFLAGLVLLLQSINQWRLTNFGGLDYAHTMRWVIPGVTWTVLGFETVLNSFFGSILGMRRK